jgi:solute carrier family 35, member E3
MQGWTLLLAGPFVDRLVVGRWVSSYEPNVPALVCLAASCTVAVLVNVSQFMCLGRFSAVTFQVLYRC